MLCVCVWECLHETEIIKNRTDIQIKIKKLYSCHCKGFSDNVVYIYVYSGWTHKKQLMYVSLLYRKKQNYNRNQPHHVFICTKQHTISDHDKFTLHVRILKQMPWLSVMLVKKENRDLSKLKEDSEKEKK